MFFSYQCAPQEAYQPKIRMENKFFDERWLEADDLLELKKDMTSERIYKLLGEPVLIEMSADSLGNSIKTFTYNYKVKLYEVTKGDNRFFKVKPALERNPGPPWGKRHRVSISFKKNKLYDISVLNDSGHSKELIGYERIENEEDIVNETLESRDYIFAGGIFIALLFLFNAVL